MDPTPSFEPGGRPERPGRAPGLMLAVAVALIAGGGGMLLAYGAGGPALAPTPVPAADFGMPPSPQAVDAVELQSAALDRARSLLLVVGGAAAAVALVTSLGLEAALGTGERFPTAVRAALGASPRTLLARVVRRRVRPLLLAGLGGGAVGGAVLAAGLAVSWPEETARAWPPGGPLVLALGLVGVAIAVASAPLRYGNGALTRHLAPGGRGGDPFEGGLRRVLSVLQMTVALAMVAGAAGVVGTGTSEGAGAGEPAPNGTVVAAASLDPGLDAAARAARWGALLERARRVPTFSSESIATPGAWSGLGRVDLVVAQCGMCVRGGMVVPILGEAAAHHVVSPGFLEQAGVRVLSGRGFDEGDRAGSESVALVSRSFALANFQDGDPLGRRVRVGDEWHTVIGVVDEPPGIALGRTAGREPAVYLAALQHPPDRVDLALGGAAIDGDPLAALGSVAGVSFGTVRTLGDLRRRDAAPVRWIAAVAAAAGLVGLLAALLGARAVAAVEVRARYRDLGVRAALGATPRDLLRWVLGRTARAGLLAVVLALPLAVGVAAVVRETSGAGPLLDLARFTLLSLTLVAAAVIGAVRPARAAAAAEPARVLTEE